MDNLICAQEWQRFAEMDLNSAKHLLNMYPPKIHDLEKGREDSKERKH